MQWPFFFPKQSTSFDRVYRGEHGDLHGDHSAILSDINVRQRPWPPLTGRQAHDSRFTIHDSRLSTKDCLLAV
jgi:hypothetical protein